MTGALDARMRSLAERLVDKFGKPVTLRRTSSTYNPVTGTTSETTANHAVNAVVELYEDRLIDGSLVQVGDMRVTVPAASLSVEPSTTTDTLILDGDTWQLVRVLPVWSGEQVATYQLQVRK